MQVGRCLQVFTGPGVGSYVLVSGALTVVEERPEATAVEVIQDGQQEALIELKGCGELKKKRRRRRNLSDQTWINCFNPQRENISETLRLI